jgi:hypothetical protein
VRQAVLLDLRTRKEPACRCSGPAERLFKGEKKKKGLEAKVLEGVKDTFASRSQAALGGGALHPAAADLEGVKDAAPGEGSGVCDGSVRSGASPRGGQGASLRRPQLHQRARESLRTPAGCDKRKELHP